MGCMNKNGCSISHVMVCVLMICTNNILIYANCFKLAMAIGIKLPLASNQAFVIAFIEDLAISNIAIGLISISHLVISKTNCIKLNDLP